MEHTVSKFYHKIQFPGYYTQNEVIDKTENFFLDDFTKLPYLPFKGKLLEAGCGTGYTTHVIANVRRDIQITAIDFSEGSLEFAKKFSKENNYQKIDFEFMDLRDIKLNEDYYDLVICSGVLHHIENPKPIFHKLCKLLKNNGTIIIGLYHPWGRFSSHVRQKIFRLTSGKPRWLDPRIRNEKWTEQRKNTWFRDQYEHPHEEDYDHKVLLKWFNEEGITLKDSIPKFSGNNSSFNVYMITKMSHQGGLYIFVGKKERT